MELSWLMKFRIAAAVGVGIVLIGIAAWPIAVPAEPLGAVLAGNISLGGKMTLMVLAVLAGLIGYFICWPYGREIGILAVPAGLAIWAVRSGNMAELVRLNPTLAQRQELLATLKWEPVFWLVVVAAGFFGVLIGQKLCPPKSSPDKSQEKAESKSNIYYGAIALVGSVLIAQCCIRIFAQDIRIFDSKLGSVVAQPAAGQIVFAVLVSFKLTAFVVKKFLNASYVWPIIASAFVTAFVSTTYISGDILQHLSQRWPAVFFPNTVVCILPVQMVAFGAIGAIGGYWMAVRYGYWHRHESK